MEQNPAGGAFPQPCRQPLGQHSSYKNGTMTVPVVKWPGCAVCQPTLIYCEDKSTVKLHIYSAFGSLWPV